SVPIMFGIPCPVDQTTTQLPIEKFGVKLLSIGFVVPPERAVIWRGPMVDRALRQFLQDPNLNWGNLDYLVIDLPPGTGDAQLTLTQHAPLSGAGSVTTPQDGTLGGARKGSRMLLERRVPALGS